MQQAGQVPYLDQNDAHEQSLGQSDGSLPGPEQTLNQSQKNVRSPHNGNALQRVIIDEAAVCCTCQAGYLLTLTTESRSNLSTDWLTGPCAEILVVDSLLCTCTVQAVSGIQGLTEAEGRGSIRGCLRSREWLCRVGYLVYSAGCIVCTGSFAQYGYLLHSRITVKSLPQRNVEAMAQSWPRVRRLSVLRECSALRRSLKPGW